jgi:DNA-binding response OmpR family regulator
VGHSLRGTLSSSGVRIIMTTALDGVKNVVDSFQSLCDAYLFKPIDTGKLREHIRTLNLLQVEFSPEE